MSLRSERRLLAGSCPSAPGKKLKEHCDVQWSGEHPSLLPLDHSKLLFFFASCAWFYFGSFSDAEHQHPNLGLSPMQGSYSDSAGAEDPRTRGNMWS